MAEMDHFSCVTCGLTKNIMKRCTRCKSVYYCSRICQMKDWKTHREKCLVTTLEETKEDGQSMSMSKRGTNNILSYNLSCQHPSKISNESKDDRNLEHVTGIVGSRQQGDPQCDVCEDQLEPLDLEGLRGWFRGEVTTTYPRATIATPDGKETRITRAIVSSGIHDRLYSACDSHPGSENSVSEKFDRDRVKIGITIKCNNIKHKLRIDTSKSGEELWKNIAQEIRVMPPSLKLIHKGKILSSDTILLSVKDRAVLQAIGTVMESDEGLDLEEIECIIKQMAVDRNTAIKALRKTGELIDALLYLGNR